MDENDVVYVDISSNDPKNRYSPAKPPKRPKRHPVITTIVCCLLVVLILGGSLYAFIFFFGKGMQKSIEENMKVSGFDNTAEMSELIYNKNGLSITYKGMKETALGIEIKLLIDNKTDSKQTIQVDDFSLDRYAVSTVFSAEVPSQKRTNKSITVLNSSLEENELSIDSINSAEFKFVIIKDYELLDSQKSGLITVKLK